MHTQRAGWSAPELARATVSEGGALAEVEFVAEAERCGVCGSRLSIVKSRRRQVVTLESGTFVAREVLKHCPGDESHPAVGSNALSRLVKPAQRYGYDVVVYVGLARYLRGKQRTEIQAELLEHCAIELSQASISNLCDRFLSYLEALHLARATALRAAMHSGYPLHIDATCEHGRGGLFVCMDGWRGWVLTATRIPSEHADHLRPAVDKTIELFGDPIATVRDLGEAGANALDGLRKRDIPDLLCHYHFLGALGKKLFDNAYALLRRLLRTSNVRRDLRELLRELRRYHRSSVYHGRFGAGVVREDMLALVLGVREGEGKKDLDYPFSLTHLSFFQRCQLAADKAESWVLSPRTQPERRAIAHMNTLMNRLDRDRRFLSAATRLEKGWLAFCELRNVLQLTNVELPRAEARFHQLELPELEVRRLKEIERALERYHQELRTRMLSEQGATSVNPSPGTVILKYLKRYGDRLFGHPNVRDETGAVIAVVERTNNVAEHFFGQQKQQLRRRVGRAKLSRDLEEQPAQAALVANLTRADYVRVLCGWLENLPAAIAALEHGALEQTTPLSRTHRDSALQSRIRTLLSQERDDQTRGPPGAEIAHQASAATVS
ncbi:MAG: hypothetical protein ACR2RL_09160 [Gammaproteobacteria bacterium]